MTSNGELRAEMERLLGEYEQLRQNVDRVRERLRTMTASASSTDGTVTVRVGANGRLTGIELADRAYRRFSPSQLAAELTRLYGVAAKDVMGQAGAAMAPFLPAQVDYEALVDGDADWRDLPPPVPSADGSLGDWRALFGGGGA
jgi:DNA-binding protein YbaB